MYDLEETYFCALGSWSRRAFHINTEARETSAADREPILPFN